MHTRRRGKRNVKSKETGETVDEVATSRLGNVMDPRELDKQTTGTTGMSDLNVMVTRNRRYPSRPPPNAPRWDYLEAAREAMRKITIKGKATKVAQKLQSTTTSSAAETDESTMKVIEENIRKEIDRPPSVISSDWSVRSSPVDSPSSYENIKRSRSVPVDFHQPSLMREMKQGRSRRESKYMPLMGDHKEEEYEEIRSDGYEQPIPRKSTPVDLFVRQYGKEYKNVRDVLDQQVEQEKLIEDPPYLFKERTLEEKKKDIEVEKEEVEPEVGAVGLTPEERLQLDLQHVVERTQKASFMSKSLDNSQNKSVRKTADEWIRQSKENAARYERDRKRQQQTLRKYVPGTKNKILQELGDLIMISVRSDKGNLMSTFQLPLLQEKFNSQAAGVDMITGELYVLTVNGWYRTDYVCSDQAYGRHNVDPFYQEYMETLGDLDGKYMNTPHIGIPVAQSTARGLLEEDKNRCTDSIPRKLIEESEFRLPRPVKTPEKEYSDHILDLSPSFENSRRWREGLQALQNFACLDSTLDQSIQNNRNHDETMVLKAMYKYGINDKSFSPCSVDEIEHPEADDKEILKERLEWLSSYLTRRRLNLHRELEERAKKIRNKEEYRQLVYWYTKRLLKLREHQSRAKRQKDALNPFLYYNQEMEDDWVEEDQKIIEETAQKINGNRFEIYDKGQERVESTTKAKMPYSIPSESSSFKPIVNSKRSEVRQKEIKMPTPIRAPLKRVQTLSDIRQIEDDQGFTVQGPSTGLVYSKEVEPQKEDRPYKVSNLQIKSKLNKNTQEENGKVEYIKIRNEEKKSSRNLKEASEKIKTQEGATSSLLIKINGDEMNRRDTLLQYHFPQGMSHKNRNEYMRMSLEEFDLTFPAPPYWIGANVNKDNEHEEAIQLAAAMTASSNRTRHTYFPEQMNQYGRIGRQNRYSDRGTGRERRVSGNGTNEENSRGQRTDRTTSNMSGGGTGSSRQMSGSGGGRLPPNNNGNDRPPNRGSGAGPPNGNGGGAPNRRPPNGGGGGPNNGRNALGLGNPIPPIGNINVKIDTAELNQSFNQLGVSMAEAVERQNKVNKSLQDYVDLSSRTQLAQVEALKNLSDSNIQRNFDHLIAAVPIFDGTDRDMFLDWAERLEILCVRSGRSIRNEAIGRSAGEVQKTLLSMPSDQPWSKTRDELQRCFSYMTTKGHTALMLGKLRQKPGQPLILYVAKYIKYHYFATGKQASKTTDSTRILHFLDTLQNKSIVRKVMRAGFPPTLQICCERVLEQERQYQLIEGVTGSLNPEIMEVEGDYNGKEEQDSSLYELGNRPRNNKPKTGKCWICGLPGHHHYECDHYFHAQRGDKSSLDRIVGNITHVLTAEEPIPAWVVGRLLNQLRRLHFSKERYKKNKNNGGMGVGIQGATHQVQFSLPEQRNAGAIVQAPVTVHPPPGRVTKKPPTRVKRPNPRAGHNPAVGVMDPQIQCDEPASTAAVEAVLEHLESLHEDADYLQEMNIEPLIDFSEEVQEIEEEKVEN